MHSSTCRILPLPLHHNNYYVGRLSAVKAKDRNASGQGVPPVANGPDVFRQPLRGIPTTPPTVLAQALSFLPYELCSSIDHAMARKIPFYALHNIFRLIAASEHQLLNLMEQKIQDVSKSENSYDHRNSIAEVFAMKKLVDRHRERLRGVLQVVEARGGPVWRELASSVVEAIGMADQASVHGAGKRTEQVPPRDMGKEAGQAAESLQRTFYELAQRAKAISALCQDETARLSHDSVVHEAQRSIQQAEGLSKLTFVAFIFVPLSFTTSFFGMNISELNASGQPIWVWFVLSVPILAASLLAWWLDVTRRRRIWAGVKDIVSRKNREVL